jgi:hypothetical protein
MKTFLRTETPTTIVRIISPSPSQINLMEFHSDEEIDGQVPVTIDEVEEPEINSARLQ